MHFTLFNDQKKNQRLSNNLFIDFHYADNIMSLSISSEKNILAIEFNYLTKQNDQVQYFKITKKDQSFLLTINNSSFPVHNIKKETELPSIISGFVALFDNKNYFHSRLFSDHLSVILSHIALLSAQFSSSEPKAFIENLIDRLQAETHSLLQTFPSLFPENHLTL